MHSLLSTAVLASVSAMLSATVVHAQLPAFPGADGAAQFASGGRGGIVYHVTKLNTELDDPDRATPGTLLYGLNDGNFPGGQPRTIVFDVAGVFHLGMGDRPDWDSMGNAWDSASRQGISATDLTISGESAPGPVIIMGGTLKPSGNNIIIRNITIAAGFGMKGFWEPPPKSPPTYPALPTSFTMDAIDVSGQDILIDHVDALYCSDESISCNENANNLTVQYCNSSQALNYQGHGYGHLLQANTDYRISFLHNLNAHVGNRLPRVGSEVGLGALNDFRNNVIYNWMGSRAGYGANGQYSYNNFINNFYLEGNGGDTSYNSTAGGGTGIFNGDNPTYTKVRALGNLRDINRDGDPNDTSSADSLYLNSSSTGPVHGLGLGITLPAAEALTNVLRHVGARWWERDYDFTAGNIEAIDTPNERLIHEVITGTGRNEAWADDPYDTNPSEGVEWRNLWALRMDANGDAPFNHPAGWDVDQDGMPGEWELEHGLDPNVANNNADFDNDGYTDLEEYLNDIAAWPAPREIRFEGATNSRYALIHNWRTHGATVAFGFGQNAYTSSPWQPSRYDTAVISNRTVTVDAVGQHAGTLRVQDGGTLAVTNGWLKVADTLDTGTASAATTSLSGGHLFAGTLNKGPSGVFDFTGGTLTADIINFDLLNQGGTLSPGNSPGQTLVNGHLTLLPGSVLDFELGAANTNDSDHILVNGNLTLGGTLHVSALNGFGEGAYTLFTYSGTLNGSLQLGSLPPGLGYSIDTSVPNQVRLVVTAALPQFQSVSRVGSALILTGTGPTNELFHLLTSTDLSLPPGSWTPIDTNTLDPSGQFALTNSVNTNEPARFYLLRLP